jgi:hypothetical protein
MTDTQILVLTITFLLAAIVVLPLIWIAYKNEEKRTELEDRRAQETQARERKRRQAEAEERKREEAIQYKKRALHQFEGLRSRLKEICETTYSSPPCPKCNSGFVILEAVGEDTGVLTCRCVKCSTERRVYALSKDAYQHIAIELMDIMHVYQLVQNLVPEYAGLAVSFPKPQPRP